MTGASAWIARLLILGVALGGVEAALRVLSQSDAASGTVRLLGTPLPPVALHPGLQREPTAFDEPAPERLRGGEALTRGDLWGISRVDEMLGHAPAESSRSKGGWWQSNALGAREREETPAALLLGERRILALGDSYTNGSRVRQEDTWPALLDAQRSALDVVNFGVDGYGVAQSFLRYRALRDRVEHEGVVFVFVPGANLPRDVNVFRPLLGWKAPISTPRFSLEQRCLDGVADESGLILVTPFYAGPDAFFAANPEALEADFRAHLRCHDAHYRRWMHEPLPVIGGLFITRLGVALLEGWNERRFAAGLMHPGSEAVAVSAAIFAALSQEVEGRGGRFLLVFLPLMSEIEQWRADGAFRARWSAMYDAICPKDARCLDLVPSLSSAPPESIDEGRGSHYGPGTNRLIATQIGDEIDRRHWFDSGS